MANQPFTYDVTQALQVNNFSRTGYTFLGWSTDPSATKATYFDGQNVTNLTNVDGATVTLYAVWTRDFSITYELGENGNNNVNNPNTFNESTPDIKLLAPSRTGYVFLGWYFDSEYTNPIENSVIDVSEHLNNLTIYAKWTEASFVVTFNSNGGTNVESQIVLYNNRVTKPITPVKENGKFLGWYKDEQLTTPFNFDSDVVTSNLTLYAKWDNSTYIV